LAQNAFAAINRPDEVLVADFATLLGYSFCTII
jgi:hypothetical protein